MSSLFKFGDHLQSTNIPDETPIKNDADLRKPLKKASKNVPKYLFRMWDANSGGSSRLNTTTAITPRAFLSFKSKDQRSVYDMTRSEFLLNTTLHLANSSDVETEFSSWSHSPYFAFYLAHQRSMYSNTVHVGIIDTEELAKSNPAFHVPALGKILSRPATYCFEEEYLVHGVIQGEFYKAVPFGELCQMGLLRQLPGLDKSVDPFNTDAIRALPGEEEDYSVKELRDLRRIALSFGDTFSVPIAIVLFCCKKRPEYWSKLKPDDLDKIVHVLGGWEEIPLKWCGSRSVLCEGVYPELYEANQQSKHLTRALTTHCYGKGARGNKARYVAATAAATAAVTTTAATEPDTDEQSIIHGLSTMTVGPAELAETKHSGTSHSAHARKLAVARKIPLVHKLTTAPKK